MKRRIPDWLVVARRELLERVRTKWFIVMTILGPVMMVAMIVVPAMLASIEPSVRIQIVDKTERLGAGLVQALQVAGWKAEVIPQATPEAELLEKIRTDAIDGYLIVPKDGLTGGELIYRGDNATNQIVSLTLQAVLTATVQSLRGQDQGLSAEQLLAMLSPVRFRAEHTTGEAAAVSGMATFLLGYILMMIIYLAIILYASAVLRSVVQEKTNRVAEIMAAAAKPRALMLGKILGVGGAGLLQLTVWLTMGLLTITYRAQILGVFGASGGFSVPALTWSTAAVVLAYFIGGYFFYASLYAAIGAMVSSDQEAQQAQTPVVLLLVVPVACVQIVANDPRGTAASVLTQIPFSSPVLMPMRYLLGGATLGEVAISVAVLAASTYVVARLAARIYRVGLLMYGKRPSLRELVRWLRY